MIRDLKLAGSNCVKAKTQVCIIGAGTAGIFLAKQLRNSGVRVLLLEAGSEIASSPKSMGNYCIHKGMQYRGADFGRSFGLGGTSVLWGGQLIPLTKSDMASRLSGLSSWPIDYSEIAMYFDKVKNQLGLPVDVDVNSRKILTKYYPLLSKIGDDFELRLSSWLPFGKRNFAKAFSYDLEADADLEVWLNSSVTQFLYSSDNATQKISAIKASSGVKEIVVSSDIVVVCAGALESTRLMLMLNESMEGVLTNQGAPIGNYFSDHISITSGSLECLDWSQYNLEIAPAFISGVMHTPRLELSNLTQQQLALPSAFAHFTFITKGDSGFDIVRNILRNFQGEKQKIFLSRNKFWHIVNDVTAMSFWRGFHRRLWIPRSADLLLQVDIEQSPNWSNRLLLDDERDELGRKRLVIDWRIMQEDVQMIHTVTERTIEAWRTSRLRKLAKLSLKITGEQDKFDSPYDVYHPTGSLRMGSSPSNSVVNANLRSWTVKNCYISSTATFPSAGSANPGLTHLALTLRLAEHIRNILTR